MLLEYPLAGDALYKLARMVPMDAGFRTICEGANFCSRHRATSSAVRFKALASKCGFFSSAARAGQRVLVRGSRISALLVCEYSSYNVASEQGNQCYNVEGCIPPTLTCLEQATEMVLWKKLGLEARYFRGNLGCS